MVQRTVLRLQGRVQQYLWGRAYADSCIARLHPAEADLAKPFAELWFGAHPSAPAKVVNRGLPPLDSLLREHAALILGREVVEAFGAELPFLFKVLSIRRPLSIQAHPDEQLARELHAADPLHYPDPHHKPEVALALSPVELLYGFRAPGQAKLLLERLPELAVLVPSATRQALEQAAAAPEAVQRLYADLLALPASGIETACAALYRRVRQGELAGPEAAWVTSLSGDYPVGDVGILSFFILKLEQLAPGEAVFIAPNVPHAYLGGELIECMASSDNVVRAGLTAKYKDARTLTRMMTVPSGPLPRLARTARDGWERIEAPAREFCLEEARGSRTLSCVTENRVQLVFCLEGEGSLSAGTSELFGAGDAFLIPAAVGDYTLELRAARVFRVVVPSEAPQAGAR